MSFETAITIKEALNKIVDNKYLLPAIQREFVWKSEQIESLFDSLMRGYPIGSFLFWRVEKSKDYKFYKFIQKYNQKKLNHNEIMNFPENKETIAVLDGQQRLTALCIGLMGSYAEKLPYYRWESDYAFPEKFLCLNLLGSDEDEEKYNFKFCTEKEIKDKTDKFCWYKIGDILNIEKPFELYKLSGELTEKNIDFQENAYKKLSELYELINNKQIINYYLEKENDLDKVLNIFIRINSAGTKLNYSDLLLSIATAQWSNRDAREEMYKAVDDLNSIGNGFNIEKDFILKACLYLLKDISNIKEAD